MVFLIWQADTEVVLNIQEYHRGDSGVKENRKGPKKDEENPTLCPRCPRWSCSPPQVSRHTGLPEALLPPKEFCSQERVCCGNPTAHGSDEGQPLRETGVAQPLGPLLLLPAQQSVWSHSHHMAGRDALPVQCQHARPQGARESLVTARLLASLLK